MNRRIFPLYVVVFVGFLGYSLMIATFTPMILRNDNGMLPATSSLTERSLVLGVLLGALSARPVLGLACARRAVGSVRASAHSDRLALERRRSSTSGSRPRW